MSIIDKVVSAVTPIESNEARAQARAKAKAAASPGDWLHLVLDHHLKIERAFAGAEAASSAASRLDAQKDLAVILTGHSNAEESVLYPALAKAGEKGHATKAYAEQAGAKMEMGLLDELSPMSQEYLDKLEHIRGAVAHHVYEEESTWFIELKQKLTTAEQAKLSQRYSEEFDRYVGSDAGAFEIRRVAGT